MTVFVILFFQLTGSAFPRENTCLSYLIIKGDSLITLHFILLATIELQFNIVFCTLLILQVFRWESLFDFLDMSCRLKWTEFLLSAPLPPLDHLAIEICVTVGKWTLSLGVTVTFESSHQDYPQKIMMDSSMDQLVKQPPPPTMA